jgi:hypothetical protein
MATTPVIVAVSVDEVEAVAGTDALMALLGLAKGLSGPGAAKGLFDWAGGVSLSAAATSTFSGASTLLVTTGAVADSPAKGDSTTTGNRLLCWVRSKLITNMTAASVNPPMINRERPCESMTKEEFSRSPQVISQGVDFTGLVLYTIHIPAQIDCSYSDSFHLWLASLRSINVNGEYD